MTDVIAEWSGDYVDEVLDLLETQLGEVGIDLKTEAKSETADDEDEPDEPDDDFDDEDEDEDDEDDDEEEKEEEPE